MENPRSDQQLLQAFTESGDQRAFHELVDRYSGLIYHTALRFWNDRPLAEDVSQRVLGALAEKSSKVLRDGVPLSAWLHRTTLLEAKSARRSEARHHRKKEALMLEPDPSTPSRDDSRWRDALPHLDAAIDSLPETDRRVLLLHHVDGMTFPQIAGRLGKSTTAVQKQSQRVLLKLQQILGRRGVALSIGLIATGLSAEMVKAAPVAFTASLAAKTSFVKTTSQVIAVKKTSISAVAATILFCGVPLASQQVRIHRLESRLTRPELAAADSISRSPDQASVAGISRLRRLAKDLQGQNKDIVRYLAAAGYVQNLSDEELAELMLECATSDLSSFEQQAVFKFACGTLVRRNPASALAVLLERIPKSFFKESKTIYHDSFFMAMRELAAKDPQAARAWFQSHLDAIRDIPTGETTPMVLLEHGMRLALSQAFIFTDSSIAIEILRPVSAQAIMSDLEQHARSNSKEWNEGKEGAIRVARELLPEDQASTIISQSVSAYLETDDQGMPVFTAYEEFLDHQDLSDAEREAVILWAGVSAIVDNGKLGAAASHYRKWLESRGIGNADWHVGAALAVMQNNWRKGLDSICNLLSKQGDFQDQAIVGFLEKVDQSTCDPKQLDKLEELLEDPEPNDEPQSPATR